MQVNQFQRLSSFQAAEKIIDKFFPDCEGAILAGSVVRGQENPTSDLDIVVFDQKLPASYRESFVEFGWPIELFCHNLKSYQAFFKSDCERARPCLPRMISEGVVLKDKGILDGIKKEAETLLHAGPEKWDIATIKLKQYFLTDVLDDFIGSSNRSESIFIAGTLADLAAEFTLRTNKRWIGTSKWISRSLAEYDENFAEAFTQAFDLFYSKNDKSKAIHIVESILEPYGGRLFEGFSLGKNQ
ncbi:nucleotidyltransferase domain-containing protein [Bacillus sp. RO1]|uniref:nucleotidyltransferase domain-containing protein n=1 Tax=Bacillus sp. RO1 TaxID=2722703 RepID=UPI0014568659|nr:nucleotidyltransferase domain-containing protein [Bacillus sp. RO1]NLP51180.1 nucleotidyltransferase domain-containing protein [Bacillus sp. RO1]